MTERVIFQKKAMPVEVEAGKTYYWCACGRSARQPFCASGSPPVTHTLRKPWRATSARMSSSARGVPPVNA